MSQPVRRRKSNKENVKQATEEHRSLAETTKSRRSAESVGKIMKNRSRIMSQALADSTPKKDLQNINGIVVKGPSLKGSNSAHKKRLLDEKYKHMLCEYEAKQKELDDQMTIFERSYKRVVSSNPRKTRPSAPILITSEFTVAKTLKPTFFEERAIKPLMRLPVPPFVNHSISRQLITDDRTRNKQCPRRHETEHKEEDNLQNSPYQQTEPSSLTKHPAELNGSYGRFINALTKQIDLDSELRKWRNRVPKKLQKSVEQRLSKQGIPVDLLKLDFEEYDVLGRDAEHSQQTITNSLVLAYRKCEQHWKTQLVGQFKRNTLTEAFSRLDYDRTGSITPKILARELSILTGRNLRIRDVYRLCRRFSIEDHISAELLCETVGEK